MEENAMNSNFSGIRENLYRYVETRLLYYKLLVLEKASRVITAILSGVVVTLLVFLALILFSGAAAMGLGRAFGQENAQGILEPNYALGMLVVGGFYLLLGLILYAVRVRLFSPPIIKSIGKALFEEDEEKEE